MITSQKSEQRKENIILGPLDPAITMSYPTNYRKNKNPPQK